MDTVANLKEQAVAQTPLLVFDVDLANGQTERWSTHAVTVSLEAYEARVARHNFFEVQAASESGIDAIPRITVTLANQDSKFSQIDSAVGFKGARVRATFLFYDLIQDVEASESIVVFQGILNPPDEITESTIRLSAINRMNMQRVLLPPVRIQRRCPWAFPSTATERQEAVSGGTEGQYSRFFPCGYSAGEVGGVGNLDGGGQPFADCNFTRADCVERGMFDKDSSTADTRRFGGVEFVPATIRVRTHGERNLKDSPVALNEARYNDFVPLVYGTAWVEPPVVFARNDGNLTRMEVLLAAGKINEILTVLVNNIEIPIGIAGQDMTASGWWNIFADGGRTGGFNLNFTAPDGTPLGDPYGSLAALSIVTPNQIHDGRVLPQVRVLMEGLQVETFDGSGASQGFSFSSNPSWVLLDVLRRSGWRLDEMELASFADAAAFCDETIASSDNLGNQISTERFQCDLVVRSRRTAADLIRGIRNSARLQLTYRDDGRLAVFVENSLLLQQPTKPEGSNAPTQINGGWPAYVYADASVPGLPSAIKRREDGAPALRLFSRPIADTPNRFSVEFADRFNEYQQDSLALVDSEDIARTGQEITGRLIIDGLPTFDQGARLLKFFLDRSVEGNRFIEFETTVKGMGQRVGDIVVVTYIREGLVDQPFRILKLEPGPNYRSLRITAQLHNDNWYNDTNGQLSLIPSTQRLPGSEPSIPTSLFGDELDPFGEPQFSIQEFQIQGTDGTILTEVEVGFTPPSAGRSLSAGIPIVSLQPTVLTTGGTIEGGQALYYAVTATDGDGLESNPSFVVRAIIPPGVDTNQVQLNGLSFTAATATFSVYRGSLPSRLRQIATGQALATSFSDTGLAPVFDGAPDPHFDHANFYWRLEDTDEQLASVFSPDSVGSSVLAMTPDAFIGHAVRLVRGKGAGQERAVTTNTATTAFVAPDWVVEPDESSVFVISDNTWRFGGRARTSPARFEIPNLRDKVVQITGRSANAQNVESLEGLAIVTHYRVGGGGLGVADFDVPPIPSFAMNARGDGTVELNGIGFAVLENTQTITVGTLTLRYRDELDGPNGVPLTAAASVSDTTLTVGTASIAAAGDYVQVDREVMLVTDVQGGGLHLIVDRAQCESFATTHALNAPLFVLDTRTESVSFERAFFGTPASAAWAHTASLPNARLACAELQVENAFGESPVGVSNFSELLDKGLRILRGGQFSLQVDGTLAIQQDAAATLTVQEGLSIRDMFASVKNAPTGADLQLEVRQGGTLVSALTILDGQSLSSVVNGAELPVLQSGADLSLDVVSVGVGFPGSDLAVTIRL